MESEATTPDVCVVKAEPGSEPTVRTPQRLVLVDDEAVENVGYCIPSKLSRLR